jgi:uncharacterized protein (TIGR04255 family)
MQPAGALPKFRRPPLVEVVHGVQFRRIPMTIVHPGLFFHRLRDKYERVQTAPSLPPARELFDGHGSLPTFALGLVEPDELPRTWYVSADDTMIVQLQPDRLLLNWRRGAGEAEYPHFESVSAEFRRVFSELEAFCREQNLGSLEADQCEMTYINHIASLDDSKAVDPSDILRVWRAETDPNWDVPLEDVSFRSRYVLRSGSGEPFGRLISSLSTVRFSAPNQSPQRMLQFEVTVRGSPGAGDREAILSFHEMAHGLIVRYFASVTTEEAHLKWQRWQ